MKKYFIILILLLTSCKSESKMIDLKDKSLVEIEMFAKENKLNLTYNYEYSDIEKDKIISQSIKENSIIKNNDDLVITISLGDQKELYKEYAVNEVGRIPIMMYHGIEDKMNDETEYTGGNIDSNGYHRTKEAFINDLEFYYKEGYRMIRLNDYVNGNINTEIGKSPIVLTFDDGLVNSIKVLGLDSNGDIIIDPNCAVGILNAFKEKYPDYNVTATFFINGWLFRQNNYNDKIITYLINNGYDIGNHSYNHVNFKEITSSKSEEEIGKMYELLSNYTDKYVNIVALPFGSPNKKTHSNFKHILSATYNNKTYETISTLQVGWESDYSPFSTNFDKTFIKRIRAYDNNGKDFDIEYSFNRLKQNRYISDGNVETVTIPLENEKYLAKIDKKVIIY